MTDDQQPEPRTPDRPATLGDPGMPAAGRRPAADAGAHAEPAARLDPHAPLSADGPTVRLPAAMTPPADRDTPAVSADTAATGDASASEAAGPAEQVGVPSSADGDTVVAGPPRPHDDGGSRGEAAAPDDDTAASPDRAALPPRAEHAVDAHGGSSRPDGRPVGSGRPRPDDDAMARSAGRRDHPGGGRPDPDEETVVPSGAWRDDDAVADSGAAWRDDEPTTSLTGPPAPFADDEPTTSLTAPLSRSADDEPTTSLAAPLSRSADDEPTTSLTAPPAPFADDEPTTSLTAPPAPSGADAAPDPPVRDRSLGGGSTMRLQPPFFAPGTTRTPRPATGPGAGADRFEPLGAAAESGDRWTGAPAGARERDTPELWQDRVTRAAAAADEKRAAEHAGIDDTGGGDARGHDTGRGDARGHDTGSDAARSHDTGRGDARGHDTGSDDLRAGNARSGNVGGDGPAPEEDAGPTAAGSPAAVSGGAPAVPQKPAAGRRLSSAGALIWLLLALLGFTMVVQLQSNDQDAGLATARQEDLVGILSDLEARDQRLQQEINALEESQRQLTSGVAGRQAALAEAGKRAEELGLLSGTLPARGPGLKIVIDPKGQPIKASAILNAVQELRGAGGEVMEIIGDNGVAVRIVASSYFVDADGGRVIVDGKKLSGPWTLWVIGVPSTMQTALQIPGGVVASVSQAGGNVTMEQRTAVEVTTVRQPTSLQYARPVS
ncbi:hypothetical protein GCM10020358_84280 [Amorphoplanes nipponensis]|uniref:DUF881 domain-containing protein n=1 Tax=Actinoplanes nipponensis TaxID=135950 RepID=A0A919JG98_9ACTN|nr:DUF881 domain-containing protein [Actinoplanes nipponensis]GIE48765.1 hypothetical protein Ani05nite_22990 [Actinoplanes nipponensis]